MRGAIPSALDILVSGGAQPARQLQGREPSSMPLQPSASYSITLRIETAGVPGTLGRVTSAIGETGGVVGAIDLVSVTGGRNVRDITVSARSHEHEQLIVDRVSALGGINRPSGLTEVTQFAVEKWGAAKTRKRKITASLTATMMSLMRADSRIPITSSQVVATITTTAGTLRMAPVDDQACRSAS